MTDREYRIHSLAYECAMDSIGMYPAAVVTGMREKKRTPWQDGYNAAILEVDRRVGLMNEYLLSLPREVIELVERERIMLSTGREDKPEMFVNCSDLFFWGCADGETFTLEDLPDLQECLSLSPDHGELLWVARRRGERPQGAYYSEFTQEEADLFNAAGPEREVGYGNPYDNKVGMENGYGKYK